MALVYVIRTPFPGSTYRRGDIVEDPSVFPKHLLDAHCTKYESAPEAARTPAPSAPSPKPDSEK